MPNWCTNYLTVTGSEKRITEFDAAFKGKPALWPVQDFELKGRTREEAEEEKKKEWEGKSPQYTFNALYPVPDEVLKVGYSVPSRDVANVLFGAWTDGYHWCIRYWGTKWDLTDISVSEIYNRDIEYIFLTAWSPPVPWLARVSEDWPDLTFELNYFEEGIYFAGTVTCEGGDITRDIEIEKEEVEGFIDLITGREKIEYL